MLRHSRDGLKSLWSVNVIDCFVEKNQTVLPIDEAVGLSSDTYNVESIIERRERQEQLLRSVEGLPEKLRLAVQLFYFQGYSIKEISSCLGVTPSILKKRLFDARKKLRTSLLVSDFVSVFNDLYEGGQTMLHIVNGDHVGDKLKKKGIYQEIF